MAMARWTVVLTHRGSVNSGWDFPANYFPRKFHYKKDAERCRDEVVRKGGNAELAKGQGKIVK